MKIAAILPHVGVFGGCRRFFELGNVFVARGDQYTIHLPKLEPLTWFDYKGAFALDSQVSGDVVLCGHAPSVVEKPFQTAKGARYVWVIGGGDYYIGLYKQAPLRPGGGNIKTLVNNRSMASHFPKARLCEGGVNTQFFTPKKRRVLYLGIGRGPKKGEDQIRQALGDLPNVELIAIKGLSNAAIRDAYHSADCLVSWEQHDGWGNGAAEAVACGLQVVTNGRNVQPFSDRVIVLKNEVSELRRFFENPMSAFSWEKVANRLLTIWKEDRVGTRTSTP